ncbi:MKI67 FHA domain-interacting nucleolar phosphoprotein-like [Daphnia pulex]|uniref:MKI67 FHA domain-interacting nucleolar phosphoprotein-like n=1 Tax=Daphnia pulex TaxID=6669 RepID=UPI001EDEBE9D|nr:MKI67 FHA domain-interacting nucleolar phosphoprotein-like [Daphnia pulex]
MTDVVQEIKKSEKKKKTDVKKTAVKKNAVKKTAVKSTKSDATLLKDAKKRIMSRQKKTKKDSKKEGKVKVKTTKKNPKKRGVVYLGHIPHGFYEEELRGFFSQFGEVSRVKVSRSSKTGKSKGYAFIEFAFNDVAKIVAETMNNYLMFERLVKAQYIPPEKVHSNTFPIRFMTPECYPALVRRNRVLSKQDKPVTEVNKKKHRSRIQFKISRAVSGLKELGIDHHPQIYDPEVGELQNESISLTNDDEVPQLVAIQPSTTTENKPSKKVGKALKKDNVKVKPTTDSTPTKPTNVTADAVSVAVQPTTPEKTSPKITRNQRKALLKKNKDNAVEVKPTKDSSPAAPTEAEKVLKLDQKASPKANNGSNTKESPKGKRKSLAVTETNPAASVAVSQSPSKRSKLTTPAKADNTPSKKDSKVSAKPSPQPAKTSEKAKPKTLEKATAPSKLPVLRSVKGKKSV